MRLLNRAVIAMIKADSYADSSLACALCNWEQFGGPHRAGFFDEDMFAGRYRCGGNRRQAVVRSRDQNDVYVRPPHRATPIQADFRARRHLRQGLCALTNRIAAHG